METRNIVDGQGNIIGELSLPIGTSELVWAERLAKFLPPAPPSPKQLIIGKIAAYKKEGEQLMDYFKADNTLNGITVQQSADLFQRVQLVIICLREGALPTAIHLAEQVEVGGFLTQELKDSWIAEMRSKL